MYVYYLTVQKKKTTLSIFLEALGTRRPPQPQKQVGSNRGSSLLPTYLQTQFLVSLPAL